MGVFMHTLYYVSLFNIQAGSTTVKEATESKRENVHKGANASSATEVCVYGSLVREFAYVQCVSLPDQSHART